MTQYQVPTIDWQDYPKGNEDNLLSRAYTLVHEYNLMQSNEANKIIALYYNKHTKQSEPYVSATRFNSLQEAKDWVEQTHYPSALLKMGLKLVDSPTTCRWEMHDQDDWDYYNTSCGEANYFGHGTVKDNEYNFCPYCGGRIIDTTEYGEQDE